MPPALRLTVLADPCSVSALWSVPLSRQASSELVIRVICGHAPSCGFFPYVQVYSVRTFIRLSSATSYTWRSRSALSGSFFPVYLLCVAWARDDLWSVSLCTRTLCKRQDVMMVSKTRVFKIVIEPAFKKVRMVLAGCICSASTYQSTSFFVMPWTPGGGSEKDECPML